MKKFLSILLGLSVILGVVISEQLVAQEIEGDYQVSPGALGKPPAPNSLDKVKIIEIYSISCGYCYNFFKSSSKFHAAFDSKIEFTSIEIGWIGDNLVRFLEVANDEGKLYQAQKLLFGAFHEAGSRDLNNPKVLDIMAREIGLSTDYAEKMKSKALSERLVKNKTLINRFGVRSTPSFVIQDSLIVSGEDQKNLAKVVNSVLKEKVKF